MSAVIAKKSASKYKPTIDRDINPILDETYIRLNHIKILINILLYIFSLKVVGGRINSPEVLKLKNQIIESKKKGDKLINDFNDIKMIIDFSKFIFGNYQGIYHYIDEKYNKKGGIIKPSRSDVTFILYRMTRIFIYDRELLFPFTDHTENKIKYLIKYNYNYVTEQEDYKIFEKFKKNFIDQFWTLFDDLDKLIDDLKLDVIFKIKYSFLYKLVDIAVNCMFSNTNNSYSNNYDFTKCIYSNRTLLNISKSYDIYYNIVNIIIENIKNINETLQDKLTECNRFLNSISSATTIIGSIKKNVINRISQMVEFSNLSTDINYVIINHIEKILTTSELNEHKINTEFRTDFFKYNNSIERQKTIIYNQ